jgi:hypothetical protein
MHSMTPDEIALVLTVLVIAVFLVGIVAVAIGLQR